MATKLKDTISTASTDVSPNDSLTIWTRVYTILPHRHAVAVDLYFRGTPQTKIAELLEVTQPQISNIISQSLAKLRKDKELSALWDRVTRPDNA